MPGLFTIPISGLKEGLHNYNFEIDNRFFDQFEESEVKEGVMRVSVEADRRSSHIDMLIRISGEVTIACDRCLGIFSHPVNCENRLLVKFGKGSDYTDPDIITVPSDGNELDMRQYFYEYILLALPIQKVHPVDKKGRSMCDPNMLSKLNEHLINKETREDPRWDELKKLIYKN
jgi:uncharacterized metal-binding protein YceD (DUF177 family)